MRNVQGFTLIELMLVVAIIGILAAIALPSYQEYIARSQMTEAIELMAGFKQPLAEFYHDKGHWPSTIGPVGSTTDSLNGNLSGKYTSAISISGGGGSGTVSLTATMNAAGIANAIQGKTVILSSGNGATWTCASGTVDSRYLPAACR